MAAEQKRLPPAVTPDSTAGASVSAGAEKDSNKKVVFVFDRRLGDSLEKCLDLSSWNTFAEFKSAVCRVRSEGRRGEVHSGAVAQGAEERWGKTTSGDGEE
ncbi:hypothetical protein chiPu_0023064 [Chiloscyllium punctatum]|uniref:Uncharacterized protein n=1 Tax=Chiloscyllium punctatum TaxID=137246 RepID=A0A401T9U0_CHIPU|nr:hypothetical protein [Chiloscyllium punctatum]